MKLLNPSDYYEIDENDRPATLSLYYMGESGFCYSGQYGEVTPCDFTNTGLKNDTTRNLIEEAVWFLGGASSSLYSDQIYVYERGDDVYELRLLDWVGKIALMYPSDYGYATDFTRCSEPLTGYSSSNDSYACRTNDWLYNSAIQWLLTPDSIDPYIAWRVYESGSAYWGSGLYVLNAFGVRPTLYISADLGIESGDGSLGDPYTLRVS